MEHKPKKSGLEWQRVRRIEFQWEVHEQKRRLVPKPELEGGQDKETSIDAKLDGAGGKSDERSDCEDELDYEDSDGVHELVFVFTTVVLLMFSVFSCAHIVHRHVETL